MKDNRIRNLWKQMIAVLLTGVMLAGAVPVDVLAAVLSEEDVIRLEEELNEDATEWQGEDEIYAEDEVYAEDTDSGEVNESEQATGSLGVGEVEVTATNSFGELLTEVYNTEAAEQEENNGCNVFSVEVSGTQATVDFETVEDGTVVVCIYEEDGNKMLASGSTEVEAGETLVDVTIETGSMPDYFYLRAFLVDTISLRPLCTVYESPMYTKEMQDFLSKTTDDFDAERVLNLDDDKTNNFAVFEEDTKFVEQGQNTNIVVSVDETNHVYIIENPDESITSLVAGDIFSCEYGDGDLLIVKVASVATEGNQAVITGMETSMEEVFEYVKIDESVGVDEASVDSSDLEEGVIYEGIVEEEGFYNDAVSNQKIEIGGSVGQSLKYTFAEKMIGTDMAGIKLSGTLNLNVTTSLKVYITLSKQYVEWKLDYAMGLKASISGHAKGEVPLSVIAFSPMVGVFVEFVPSFVVETSAAVSLSGSVSGTVGVRVSNSDGIKNLTTNPQTSILLEGEFEVFIGIEFNPRIKVISDHVAKLELAAQVGARAEGTWFGVSSDMDKNCVHDCDRCIEGKVHGVLGGSMSAQIFNSSKLKWSKSYDWSVKICDFYWSKTFNDCGLSKCPHRRYRVTVELFDTNKEPIRGAVVNGAYKTGDDGKVVLYLPLGKNTLTIVGDEIGTVVREVKAYVQGNRVQMRIDRIAGEDDEEEEDDDEDDDKSVGEVSLGNYHSGAITENGDLYMWGMNEDGQLGNGTKTNQAIPIKIMENVKTVSLGMFDSGAITENGDLYIWGDNDYGELGYGTKTALPIKIMENVKTVSLGTFHSAVITENGDLYMWGMNEDGQLGDGTETDQSLPIKIMENVKMVSLGDYHSAAITKKGDLYMWGMNEYGQLGDGTKTNRAIPIKVMENVKMVSLGDCYSGAITENGDLYMWGWNLYGQLGDGTQANRAIPIKIMENVKMVSLGWDHSAAITEKGDLYMWGENFYGQLGNGTRNECAIPIKIMENVKTVSLRNCHSAAITEKGDLYMWGMNEYGELGDGTTEWRFTPTKITLGDNANMLSEQDLTEDEVLRINEAIIDLNANSQITGLLPNETYNYYIMKSTTQDDLLIADNLLSLRQLTSDSNGTLKLEGEPREEYAGAKAFVVGMTRADISTAEVTVQSMTYTGKEQSVVAGVVCQGKALTEGRDYVLCGDYSAKEVGNYELVVKGIGLYTGEKKVTYRMNEGQKEKDWIFTDVPKAPGNWKYDNVKYVYDHDIMNGIAGTTLFDPDGKLNRAMFATVLYRMAGSPQVEFANKFSDVQDGKYYSSAIIWANKQGIVSGFSDGSYGVNTNITREQIAKMLYEYASKSGYDVSGAASIDTFTDTEAVSGWAVGYMKWAVDAGMISGKPNGDGTFRLDPKGEATRAECAKMLTMFMKKYQR